MKVKIQPWIHEDKTAVNIEIPTIMVLAGKQAIINCALTSEDGSIVYASRIDMPQENYNQWGSDDLYLVNYCANYFKPPAVVDGPLTDYSKIDLLRKSPQPSGSAPAPSGSAP